MRSVKAVDNLVALAINYLDLALSCDINKDKLALPVCVLTSYNLIV